MGIINWFIGLFKKEEEPLPKKKFKKRKKKLSPEEKKLREEKANTQLREDLALEKNKPKNTKSVKINETKVKLEKKIKEKFKKNDSPSILLEAQEAANSLNLVLYISCTVKRLQVIEWRHNKKKTLLNKEREIRHTHKGGFSQEKFQSFVDSQKKKTFEWIEGNLNKNGVLRGPYDQILVESNDSKLKEKVEGFLERFNA